MITKGFVIQSTRTRSRVEVLEGTEETHGWGWLLEVTCQVGSISAVSEHYHKDWTEVFEIVSGGAWYQVDGVRKTARAGESFTVNPGHAHLHPWNAGETVMVYRQRDRFATPSPDAVQDVLGALATMNGLHKEGKSTPEGYPKSRLQLAACLRLLVKHGGYSTAVPEAKQDSVARTLGSVAGLLGFKGTYPRFTAG